MIPVEWIKCLKFWWYWFRREEKAPNKKCFTFWRCFTRRRHWTTERIGEVFFFLYDGLAKKKITFKSSLEEFLRVWNNGIQFFTLLFFSPKRHTFMIDTYHASNDLKMWNIVTFLLTTKYNPFLIKLLLKLNGNGTHNTISINYNKWKFLGCLNFNFYPVIFIGDLVNLAKREQMAILRNYKHLLGKHRKYSSNV